MPKILLVAAVFLSPLYSAQAQESYDSIVIVLDGSGSMDGRMGPAETKMQAAKSVLTRVLEQIEPTTHVGILAFGSVGAGRWIYPLSPINDRGALRSAIAQLDAAGGTPLGECIKQGADELLKDRAAKFGYGSSSLLVITDGEANDPWLVDEYAPEIVARGIRLDVIGVAMKKDHTLAQSAHSYRRADDPAALERAVSTVFAEVTAQSTDAAPGEGAFELAAAFEPEMALEVIGTLANSGNQPLGEAPASDEPVEDPETVISTPSVEDPESSGGGFARIVFFLFAIGLFVVIRRAAKSKS